MSMHERLRRAFASDAADFEGSARRQAIRERMERHEAMIARTNLLASMTDEQRQAYWQQEAEQAAAQAAAAEAYEATQHAAALQADRLQRWQEWLEAHPRTTDMAGRLRHHRADSPPDWFE